MIDKVPEASHRSLAVLVAEYACQAIEKTILAVKCSRECNVGIFDNGRVIYAKVKYKVVCAILSKVFAKLSSFLEQ